MLIAHPPSKAASRCASGDSLPPSSGCPPAHADRRAHRPACVV